MSVRTSRLAIVSMAGTPTNVPGLTTYLPPPDPQPPATVTPLNWAIAIGVAFLVGWALTAATEDEPLQEEFWDDDEGFYD